MTSVYNTGTQVSGRTSNRNVAHSEHVCKSRKTFFPLGFTGAVTLNKHIAACDGTISI